MQASYKVLQYTVNYSILPMLYLSIVQFLCNSAKTYPLIILFFAYSRILQLSCLNNPFFWNFLSVYVGKKGKLIIFKLSLIELLFILCLINIYFSYTITPLLASSSTIFSKRLPTNIFSGSITPLIPPSSWAIIIAAMEEG